MKSQLRYVLLLPVLLSSGCTGPDLWEFAVPGISGAYVIYIISFITLLLITKIRKIPKIYSNRLLEKKKTLLKFFYGLTIFGLIYGLFPNRLTYPGPQAWILTAIVVFVLAIIPTVLYTLMIFGIILMNKGLAKYSPLIPLIITAFYVITLLAVIYLRGNETYVNILMGIWTWPLYVAVFINALLNGCISFVETKC